MIIPKIVDSSSERERSVGGGAVPMRGKGYSSVPNANFSDGKNRLKRACVRARAQFAVPRLQTDTHERNVQPHCVRILPRSISKSTKNKRYTAEKRKIQSSRFWLSVDNVVAATDTLEGRDIKYLFVNQTSRAVIAS
jgi:hypothetical protein